MTGVNVESELCLKKSFEVIAESKSDLEKCSEIWDTYLTDSC